ncbi:MULTISPECIES: hypothetical protein [Streptomyces]|uniref:hypothetical protein n=1 Tax=Streptomyces TaxID=1883 RepID=UPI001F28FF1B|nr:MULTISPECIES: hypothetical protein [Streptomyces]MCY1649544.1 hypothetical protein [Streptomyces sp. SL203]MDF6060403.1 hypothetical protein [Streptomyces sp. JH010]WSZ45968.1 hypothetical protein OG337_00985 [[Kitasatospora] papulosa]
MRTDLIGTGFRPLCLPRERLLLVSGAVAAVMLLAGCSGSDVNEEPGVDSVDRSTGTAEKAESGSGGGADADVDDSEAGRPQRRMDTSAVEELRMSQGYFQCLKSHGVRIGEIGSKVEGADPDLLAWPGVDVSVEHPDAEKKCLGKKPLPPAETDPERNPNYMSDYAEYIQCMNEKGLKVDPLPNGEGWNYKAGTTPPRNADQIDQECMIEAFSE